MPFDWAAFRPAPDGHADWSRKPNWHDQTDRLYFAKELLQPFQCKNAGSCAPSFLAAELMRVAHEGAARTKDVRIGWNPVPGADDKPRRDASGKILFADWHYTYAEAFWHGSQWISHALFHIARDIVADDPPELARPFFEELADLAAHPPFDPDGFAARESAIHSTPWDDRRRGWWNDRADFIEDLVRAHESLHGWSR